MKKQLEWAVEWLNAHDFRDQCILLLISFAAIYIISDALFNQPLVKQNRQLIEKMSAEKKETETLLGQISLIAKVVNNHAYKKLSPTGMFFHPAESVSRLTSDIINQKSPDIVLVNLKNLADQPWNIPGEPQTSPSMITQHTIQLDFLGNYFSSIDYLARLEKLPWHVYWDTLEYKVLKYPQAEVIVKLYVLSKKQ